jgi:diadenylate cyclase
MFDGFWHLFARRSASQIFADVVDLAIVAYLIYRVLLVLRGTRAMQMGFGLLVLGAIYVIGKWLGLVTLVTLLSTLLSSIILVVVVVFQSDLRRGLMRAGGRPLFVGLTRDDEAKVIEEIIAAVSELARLRHGAIITWERDANLDEFIVGAGTTIDAQVTRELLVSVFIPVGENKLHDGAVIIRNLRIAQAGVFFPMPEKHGLDKQFGSRHRAAIGITADTDALAIVVSEERGTIMFCFQENHVDNVTPDALRNLLRRYEQPKKRKVKAGPPSSRRPSASMPPPPTSSSRGSMTPTPLPTKALVTGPVVIKPPPPTTQRQQALTPSPPPISEKEPAPVSARASMPPPAAEAPPEEGTDQ